jgi:ERCC4-related helicase
MQQEMKRIIVSEIFKKRQNCSKIVFCAYRDCKLIIGNQMKKIKFAQHE